MIQFIKPKLKHRYNPSGVYKISFNNGYFYIGSSKKLKSRFNSWETPLSKGKTSNRYIKSMLQGITIVNFEIIEICDNYIERELYHIQTFLNDDYCLNMSNGTGKLKRLSYLEPIKIIKHKNPVTPRKKVFQYSLDGQLIRIHDSICATRRMYKLTEKELRQHLKKRRPIGCKGYIFRLTEWQKPPKKEKNIFLPLITGKPIIDLNTGVFYYSAKELSAYTTVKRKQLYKMLSGERRNTTQYRYA